MTPSKKYEQIYDGQETVLIWDKQKLSCCGCGLTHIFDFKIKTVKGVKYLFAKIKIDNRATAAIRRYKK